MPQVTGYTAERMKAIEDASVVNGEIDPATGHLMLTRFDETVIDAGLVTTSPKIVTSATRPTGAALYEGLQIYETDTDRLLTYNGSAWIDRGYGVIICTSGTRPTGASLFEGLVIYETDTDNWLTYNGTYWVNRGYGVVICTSGTRPATNLYNGMKIYETDTKKYYTYDGAVWVQTSSLAGWDTYTPAFSGTLGNGTLFGRWTRLGRVIHFTCGFTWGSTTSHPGGGTVMTLGLPVAPDATRPGLHGNVEINQAGTGRRYHLVWVSGSNISGQSENSATITTGLPITAWANGHYWNAQGTYMAAAGA